MRRNELSVEDVFPAHYIMSYDRILFNFICPLFTNRKFVLEGIYSSIHALARAVKVLGLLQELGYRVLGCSIPYCSYVK